MQKRWKYFLKNIKDDTLEFSAVINTIRLFLEPVFNAILYEEEWEMTWKSKENLWVSTIEYGIFDF